MFEKNQIQKLITLDTLNDINDLSRRDQERTRVMRSKAERVAARELPNISALPHIVHRYKGPHSSSEDLDFPASARDYSLYEDAEARPGTLLNVIVLLDVPDAVFNTNTCVPLELCPE